MDSISPIPVSANQTYTPPAPGAGSDTPAQASPPSQVQAPDAKTVADTQTATDQTGSGRKAVVQRVAEQMFKDSFPVSDVKFTIYKDPGGQYVTRFTSLKDGKVTYYPEQTMFAYFQRLDDHNNIVNIRA